MSSSGKLKIVFFSKIFILFSWNGINSLRISFLIKKLYFVLSDFWVAATPATPACAAPATPACAAPATSATSASPASSAAPATCATSATCATCATCAAPATSAGSFLISAKSNFLYPLISFSSPE